ncbi:MAG: hypothetical protein GY953_45340 [bacterium]|nr:hypothetical protein [bacterium]
MYIFVLDRNADKYDWKASITGNSYQQVVTASCYTEPPALYSKSQWKAAFCGDKSAPNCTGGASEAGNIYKLRAR